MKHELEVSLARVRAALARRGCSSHEAEDLAQEAWIRMARYARTNAVECPEAFLMRTAINLSIDAHRSVVRRGEEVSPEAVLLVDESPSAEARLLAREQVARLELCLRALSSKTRNILLANRLQGLTHEQIAQQNAISVSAVEKHVARAMWSLELGMEGY